MSNVDPDEQIIMFPPLSLQFGSRWQLCRSCALYGLLSVHVLWTTTTENPAFDPESLTRVRSAQLVLGTIQSLNVLQSVQCENVNTMKQ